jgi:RNA polymerase sigma-70 factor (ECF subfamily)
MTLARNGNVSAFNELVELHSPIIFNVCVRLLRDAASAEDATQDTFIRAWSALKTWHGGNVRPWLIRIATNRCYDMLRSQARRPASSLDADPYEIEPRWSTHVDGPEDPEQFSIRADLSAYLERALALLPDDQRLAIILVDVHGLSYEEVAEVAGVAVGTVKSRISRARGRLRDQLRDGPDSAELFGEICRPRGEDDASRR